MRAGRWSWAVTAGWFNCLVTELFLNSCLSGTGFLTLFRTAVETAISKVHKLLGTGGVPTSLTLPAVLAVADGLFGLYAIQVGTPGRMSRFDLTEKLTGKEEDGAIPRFGSPFFSTVVFCALSCDFLPHSS